MTNLEALKAEVPAEIGDNDDNMFIKALLDVSLAEYNTYTASTADTVKEAAVKVIDMLLRRPDVSDGSSSIKFDRGHLKAERNRIVRELDDNIATIDGTNRW